MKTIIAGSRSINDVLHVVNAVHESGFQITTVVSGMAKGADRGGELWAKVKGLPIERYQADWRQHKRAAGYIRNMEMARNAEALIAIWDGESKGTEHMITIARERGLKVYVYNLRTIADPQPEDIGDQHPDCDHEWFIHDTAYCPKCGQNVVLNNDLHSDGS